MRPRRRYRHNQMSTSTPLSIVEVEKEVDGPTIRSKREMVSREPPNTKFFRYRAPPQNKAKAD